MASSTPRRLRRVLVGSGTSLLGLVHHLTGAERVWFGHHVAGGEDTGDLGMEVPGELTAEAVLAGYRAAIAESDAAIRVAGDPERPIAVAVDGTFHTLRWVPAHMTSETARHADILREQIDGVTGRCRPDTPCAWPAGQ
ncbi:hypothetical protein Amsp01_028390 [Amycolatopsis sp. NBRC 101858]|uniref:mycothiol transferase n=1 Tax=Amycolatopsis sp. NBRC 101858 TaxID=3032200 RepID=UPI00249FC33D|nr:DUF664 domain-containing protein [Amycolatopsis sp. NBRC 101858]GLY36815.1 hypothetical protein Amsp01_028390 [Amycolatopsis sp. NBRC 101858]